MKITDGNIKALVKKKRLRLNEPMAGHTTMMVGGAADMFAEAENYAGLNAVLAWAGKKKLPVSVVGSGSNVIVADRGIRGLVLCLSGLFKNSEITGNRICAGAGVRLGELVRKSALAGLAGFEFAAGIPGTVGGAIVMNAGLPGKTTGGIVRTVTAVSLKGRKRIFTRKEMKFGYRDSSFKGRKWIITEAEFELKKGNRRTILKRIRKLMKIRHRTQPGKPSAGSVFRNPESAAAGYLIDRAGLKGFRIGGAEVSTKHANFIVNTGNASAGDVLDLISLIKMIVRKKAGIELKEEVEILGEGNGT